MVNSYQFRSIYFILIEGHTLYIIEVRDSHMYLSLSNCKHLSMKIYLDEGMRDCKERRGCRITPREKGNREQTHPRA